MYQFIFYALSIAQSSTNFELETIELFSLGKFRIYQCLHGNLATLGRKLKLPNSKLLVGSFRIDTYDVEGGVSCCHVSSQYGHSRYRLRHFEHKSHGSKPCLGPFTYPLPLYVWSEPMYGFLRDIHRCFLYALVHGCRLPRTIQKPFRCIAGMHSLKLKEHTTHEIEERA